MIAVGRQTILAPGAAPQSQISSLSTNTLKRAVIWKNERNLDRGLYTAIDGMYFKNSFPLIIARFVKILTIRLLQISVLGGISLSSLLANVQVWARK